MKSASGLFYVERIRYCNVLDRRQQCMFYGFHFAVFIRILTYTTLSTQRKDEYRQKRPCEEYICYQTRA